MLERRRLLTLGGVIAGGVLLGPKLGNTLLGSAEPASAAAGGHAHDTAATAPASPQFAVEMPIPRVLRPVRQTRDGDFYRLPMRKAYEEMLPGVRTEVMSYGGSFVGPTIRARAGRPVVVEYVNQLTEAANAHLHGGHTPAASDGNPMQLIEPGSSLQNHYPNGQRGATLWYHDHTHHAEAEHVYRGMHGFYLLEEDDERRLRLPADEYDVPVMLTDAHFDPAGGLIYAPTDTPNRTTLLANGRPSPYFPVHGRKYRFRLLNVSNFRTYRLSLGGAEMVQIGSDGGLLPTPVARTEITLSPAERAEIVIDFARYRSGRRVVLSDVSGPVLQFRVGHRVPDPSRVPDVLRPLPPLTGGATTREITMKVDMTKGAAYINGKSFDPDRVDTTIKAGSTEIWRISNSDTDYGLDHNMHLHLVQFRVLDRDGKPPLPGESGLKDTVLVPAGQSVRVEATFSGFTGRYLYHCHMLEHAAWGGMMAQMEIVA
jgi:spore coat protein A